MCRFLIRKIVEGTIRNHLSTGNSMKTGDTNIKIIVLGNMDYKNKYIDAKDFKCNVEARERNSNL
jgi:hypothetical protein